MKDKLGYRSEDRLKEKLVDKLRKKLGRKKSEKFKGSFFYLVARNQIILTVSFAIIAVAIYGTTSLYAGRLSTEASYERLESFRKAFVEGRYSDIPFEEILGMGYRVAILNEKGKPIFEDGEKKVPKLSPTEMQLIQKLTDPKHYFILTLKTNGGLRYIVTSRENFNEGFNSEISECAVLTPGRKVVDGNLFPIGSSYTEKELQLAMGQIGSNKNIRKYDFVTKEGHSMTAVFVNRTVNTQKYQKALMIWEISWMVLIPLYMIMSIVAMFLFGMRTRRLLAPFNRAIFNLMSGEPSHMKDYRGPDELVEVAENFNTMAERLNDSEAKRRRMDEERQKMLADISHDLKTPITVIQGYSKAICDGLVPPNEIRKYLNIIYIKTNGLTDLITEFSEYGKLEHPEFSMDMKRIDLCEFCKSLLAEKYGEFEVAGYKLDVDIPDSEVFSDVDEIHLKRVFDNIITNSIKYNEKGTKIYFKINVSGSIAIITIGDDGVGIPRDIARNLFKPFIVGDEARTSKQGTGLGLSIAKSIVEKHGGTIRLVYPPEKPYKTQYVIYLLIKEQPTLRNL